MQDKKELLDRFSAFFYNGIVVKNTTREPANGKGRTSMKRVLCVLLCALLCALAGCALAQVTDGTYSVTVPSYSVTEQMTLEVTF